MNKPNVAVIIPAYNEELTIGKSVHDWMRTADEAQGYTITTVLVVANGCNDATAYRARNALAEVYETVQAGKWRALRAGVDYLSIVKRKRPDVIIMADVDGSVNPRLATNRMMERYIDAAYYMHDKTPTMLIASREEVGSERIGEPVLRHWMGRVYNLLAQAALPEVRGLRDTQCGYKIANAAHLFAVLNTCRVDGFGGDVEMISRWKRTGGYVQVAPCTWTYGASSTVRPGRDTLAMLRELWQVRRSINERP